MSETYVSDNLELNLNTNEIREYLLESFGSFKLAHSELCNELYSKSRSYQQDLIYRVLDLKYNSESQFERINELQEIFEFDIFRTLSNTNIFLYTIYNAKSILKLIRNEMLSPEHRFIIGLIDKNYNNCNNLCKPNNVNLTSDQLISLIYVDPSKMNNLEILNFSKKYPAININSIGKCLRMCYLDYMTSIYVEGIISYENCQSNLSGKKITINRYNDILNNYPLTDACNEIYKLLNELFSNISDLLDFIYSRDTMKKNKWLDVINDKLNTFRRGGSYHINFNKIDDEFEYPSDNVRIV